MRRQAGCSDGLQRALFSAGFQPRFQPRFLYPQKRSDGRLKPFSRPFLYFMLRSTGPPRWRVSSVGERGANIKYTTIVKVIYCTVTN